MQHPVCHFALQLRHVCETRVVLCWGHDARQRSGVWWKRVQVARLVHTVASQTHCVAGDVTVGSSLGPGSSGLKQAQVRSHVTHRVSAEWLTSHSQRLCHLHRIARFSDFVAPLPSAIWSLTGFSDCVAYVALIVSETSSLGKVKRLGRLHASATLSLASSSDCLAHKFCQSLDRSNVFLLTRR